MDRHRRKRKRVLLCGSADWTNQELLQRVLDGLTPRTIVLHGDNGLDCDGNALWGRSDELAISGADKLAGRLARERGLDVMVFSPNWRRDGGDAVSRRNERMFAKGEPWVVFVFSDDAENDPYLVDCIRRAEAEQVYVNRISSTRRVVCRFYGRLAPDDPRWRDDWSITVGPGATCGSRPPFAGASSQPGPHPISPAAEADAEMPQAGTGEDLV